MIPSLVASEVEQALRDFLTTQFQPSNPELSGIIDNFLSDRSNLLKGPYLSIALPFQRVNAESEPFPEISLGFAPYRHQQTAFEWLSAGKSTVVATGTGSGKTECFPLPDSRLVPKAIRRAGHQGHPDLPDECACNRPSGQDRKDS